MGKGWGVFRVGDDVHVVPEGDLVPHWHRRQCLCRPIVMNSDVYLTRIIHFSYDGREFFETDPDTICEVACA